MKLEEETERKVVTLLNVRICLGYRIIRIRKRGKKTCKNESALYCTMEYGDLIKERRAV